MRKKVIQQVPATQIEKEVTLCDFCPKEIYREYGFRGQCQLCKRDICKDHTAYDDDGSDYPDNYCQVCYDLKFNKYGKQRERIEKEANSQLREIDSKIKEESLRSVTD